ncbi:MAG: hypothetical protein OEY19_12870 [Gammaproteobacteria bacterium]|nr:hypothetical protein [Gammaproteobacteria bacterium]MDH5631206.1 hypothetical protein [Gammaproteobacteria bacterium]
MTKIDSAEDGDKGKLLIDKGLIECDQIHKIEIKRQKFDSYK